VTEQEKTVRRIREALALVNDCATYPDWSNDLTICRKHPAFEDLWALFAYQMEQVGGLPMRGTAAVVAYLEEHQLSTGYCDPALVERFPKQGIGLLTEFNASTPDKYEFGITRAAGAIAETGSLILTDRATSSRLAALAPWVHIAVLEAGDIYADCSTAIEKMPDDPSVTWVTGPSKTADVEGILIEGVHGPGVQIACLV
jgi:L-lactate dehydrogenase complex protein LldG